MEEVTKENHSLDSKEKTYLKTTKSSGTGQQQSQNPNYRKNYRQGSTSGYYKKRGFFYKRKICYFCHKDLNITYFSVDFLKRYITERGKIIPGRYTGNCAKHQRFVKKLIKQARMLALISFISNQ